MKKYLLFFLSAGSVTAVAQQKKPAPVAAREISITGDVKQLPNDSTVYLVEPFSGEIDSAIVKNHRFYLKRDISKGGSVYVLRLGSTEVVDNLLFLYLEAGKVNIKGDGADFKNVAVTGEKWVSEWQEVWAMVSPQKKENQRLQELQGHYAKARQVGDEDAAKEYEKEFMAIYTANITRYKEWIVKHPDAGVSGYVLTVLIPAGQQDSLYATLGDHAKQSRILKRWKNPESDDAMSQALKGVVVTATADAKVKIGEPAPLFSLPDTTGKVVKLSDFKGKYVLIDFWASWCGPCKTQLPYLKAASDKFKGKNFELLGVSLDNKKDAWLTSIQKDNLSWMQLSGLKGWEDEVAKLYGVSAIPANVLIGPDGKVIALNLYSEAIDSKLSEVLH